MHDAPSIFVWFRFVRVCVVPIQWKILMLESHFFRVIQCLSLARIARQRTEKTFWCMPESCVYQQLYSLYQSESVQALGTESLSSQKSRKKGVLLFASKFQIRSTERKWELVKACKLKAAPQPGSHFHWYLSGLVKYFTGIVQLLISISADRRIRSGKCTLSTWA